MFITEGNIENLLEWFYKKSDSSYLLLFVGGYKTDSDFYESLFEKKETIDFMSGHSISVFLAINKRESALEIDQDQEGERKIIPGMLIEPSTNSFIKRDNTPRNIHISEIEVQDVKKEVSRSSITFGHQIANHFDIEPNDLPALVLLYKWFPEPLIISTKGQADIEILLHFLKDVQSITLPSLKEPHTKKKDAKRLMREAETHLNRAEHNLKIAISSWSSYLQQLDIPSEIVSEILTPDNAGNIWLISGIEGRDAMPNYKSKDYYVLFEQALNKEGFKELCHLVKRKHYEYMSHIETVKKAQNRVKHYEQIVKDAGDKLDEIDLVNQKIEKLAKKYERKFYMKFAYQKITGFTQKVLGIVKAAKDIADVKKSVLDLLKDD